MCNTYDETPPPHKRTHKLDKVQKRITHNAHNHERHEPQRQRERAELDIDSGRFSHLGHDEFAIEDHEQDADQSHPEGPVVEVFPQAEQHFPPFQFVFHVSRLSFVRKFSADGAADADADAPRAAAAPTASSAASAAPAAPATDTTAAADADGAAASDDGQTRSASLVSAAGTRGVS